MEEPPPDGAIWGAILAGGKSSRYGKNKALVPVQGVPIIQRVLGALQSVFSHTAIISNTPEEYAYLGLPIYRDIIPGLGPLGGIYTALSVLPGEAVFCTACDMPFLSKELIQHMVRERKNYDVVVPRISGRFEALLAMYTRTCLPHVEELIRAGTYQIIRFFNSVSVRYVEEEELRRFDPDLHSFYNINRPNDLADLAPTGQIHADKKPGLVS